MRKKKIGIILLFVVTVYIAFQGISYLRSDAYKCYQLENQLRRELDLEIDVHLWSNNTVYIWYDGPAINKLYEIQQNLNSKMENEEFWISAKKYDYIIQIESLDEVPGGNMPAIKIWNKNPFDENEYYMAGVSMEIGDDFSMPEGYLFENVQFLYIAEEKNGNFRGIKEYSCLQYFPNVKYFDLRNREISTELLEKIKQQVPGDCELVNYRIQE